MYDIILFGFFIFIIIYIVISPIKIKGGSHNNLFSRKFNRRTNKCHSEKNKCRIELPIERTF